MLIAFGTGVTWAVRNDRGATALRGVLVAWAGASSGFMVCSDTLETGTLSADVTTAAELFNGVIVVAIDTGAGFSGLCVWVDDSADAGLNDEGCGSFVSAWLLSVKEGNISSRLPSIFLQAGL